ncbi:Probable LIM domain-containing serine/threonine-protein kinase DDB [Seminavis robusta]|uniref:Probable LIM domain-containing serine/threonine-protein kinase DDB n=1 Tax=Seminavis robusta TaxID=568900 RepID=A0A9N8H1W8_9STRA|nr:Probable LIM domain-containing serine/threonine-protein kinase DDB [Seminavis robusta]|eukprot:Sro9_g007180.1 Probable LIM domain-containing serine/threonine-protein kinase DDB (410) ;mRNA; f:73124-74461
MVRLELQTWFQNRIVRRTSSLLVDHKQSIDVTEDASDVDDTCDCDNYQEPVVPLHRKEIQVGKLLGTGSFSQVHEITNVSLRGKLASFCSQEEQASRQLFSATFQAKAGSNSEDTGSRYVIKHLNRKLLRRPRQFHHAAQSLIEEADVMAKLDHPNILKIRGKALGGASAFAETGRFDGFFIITDLLSGTLKQRIEEWKRAKEYQSLGSLDKILMKTRHAIGLSSALDYLHDRRIIFRDFKPDNAGFKTDDTVQLFDFGLSRTLPEPGQAKEEFSGGSNDLGLLGEDEVTYLMSLAGTTRYMASEVLLTRRYNLKADVYSFALVFFEMLAEKTPFEGFGFGCFEEYVCRLGRRPELSRLGLPSGLEGLLEAAWHQDIAERFSMKDVCETLLLLVHDMEAGLVEPKEPTN